MRVLDLAGRPRGHRTQGTHAKWLTRMGTTTNHNMPVSTHSHTFTPLSPATLSYKPQQLYRLLT